ncbi:hypothetical protein E2C01_054881 [Portunus trituberculatus]|uniref:Uncharacterized protein n=1 Tax=Portunus trituberculatus TaxID=210409 RepID=A0A5B7GW65_PORTR|nr:hypothetical protein [Portunus trituberculatus]
MTQMAKADLQVVNAVRVMREDWHMTTETMKHVESLQSKAEREKKVTSQVQQMYTELEEERKLMKQELSLLKKAYKEAQEGKVEIPQYHE